MPIFRWGNWGFLTYLPACILQRVRAREMGLTWTFWPMVCLFSVGQRASQNRCRCFQRTADRKDQAFFLVQWFVEGGGWKTKSLDFEMLTWEDKEGFWSGDQTGLLEHRKPNLSTLQAVAYVLDLRFSTVLLCWPCRLSPGDWLAACFWSQAIWCTSGHPSEQWACGQRAWIPLSRCLSKMSHGSKSSSKIVKHWWQRPRTWEKIRRLCRAVFWEQFYASFPPLPSVIEQRARGCEWMQWKENDGIHSFIYSFAFNPTFLNPVNV